MICPNCGKQLDRYDPLKNGAEWTVIYKMATGFVDVICKSCQLDPLAGLLKQSEEGELEW